MLEHKKRFTKKTVENAPAPKTEGAPKAAAKPASKEPQNPPMPAAAPKGKAQAVTAPKVEANPVAPKVEAKPVAAPKAEPREKVTPKPVPKMAALKNNIKSMPEQTLAFFANLMLWASIGVSVLGVIFGIIAIIEMNDANGPLVFAGALISAIIILVYALIIWAFTRVFVNISNTLKSINTKIPAPKEEEK